MNRPTATRLSVFIQDQLKKKGWTGVDLGLMLGCDNKSTVSKIVNGKQAPSLNQMALLAESFDVSVEDIFQMRLADELAGMEPVLVNSERQLKLIEIYKKVPISELLKRKWASVRDRKDPDEIIKVFGPMVHDFQKQKGLAHKTGDEASPMTPTQSAWLYQVRRVSKLLNVAPYSRDKLLEAIAILRRVMLHQKEIDQVFSSLSDAGVRLVFVECKGSKIDGVCTWLDQSSPVVGMTLRFDRDDNFWFVLRHELEHVLQGYSKFSKIDDDMFSAEDVIHQTELDANHAASEFCAPSRLTEEFIATSNGRFFDQEVKAFAEFHRLLPSALAGQIRHKLNRYNILNKLLKPIRENIVSAAPVVDGWGRYPMIG